MYRLQWAQSQLLHISHPQVINQCCAKPWTSPPQNHHKHLIFNVGFINKAVKNERTFSWSDTQCLCEESELASRLNTLLFPYSTELRLIFCPWGPWLSYGTLSTTRPSLVEILAKSTLLTGHRKSGSRSSFECDRWGQNLQMAFIWEVILLKIAVLKTKKIWMSFSFRSVFNSVPFWRETFPSLALTFVSFSDFV